MFGNVAVADEVPAELFAAGQTTISVKLDVAQPESWTEVIGNIVGRFGRTLGMPRFGSDLAAVGRRTSRTTGVHEHGFDVASTVYQLAGWTCRSTRKPPWTPLGAPQIAQLAAEHGPFQPSLFDERNLIELTSGHFPGERLVVCRNPALAEERSRKRGELLAATEADLAKIVAATQRARNPLRGQQAIALRVGRVIERFHMAKHFDLTITDTALTWRRKDGAIAAEAALDGLYVIRTSLGAAQLDAAAAVAAYKSLAQVERAFRSIKTVDLQVRPVFHYSEQRVRAHVFLCMLAYYVEWHMRARLKPMLFDDECLDEASDSRASPVLKAQRSEHAKAKDASKRADDGLPLHSFRTLLKDLGTLAYNITHTSLNPNAKIVITTRPTPLQAKAFHLLGLNPACTQ